MRQTQFEIGKIPTVVYGDQSDRVYLYLHGQGGNKEEALGFAERACAKGYQVLSIDFPMHGGRKDGAAFVPWEVEPELMDVLAWSRERWERISIRAVSIGVWFSLCAYQKERFACCLYSSPLLDMNMMIEGLMQMHGVDEDLLKEKKEIICEDGTVLSWDYLMYARQHSVHALSENTHILYPEHDEMIPYETVQRFVHDNPCTLDFAEGAHHWIHLKKEVELLHAWEDRYLQRCGG